KNKNSLAKLDEKKSTRSSATVVADSNQSGIRDTTSVVSSNKRADTKATSKLKTGAVKVSEKDDSASAAVTEVRVGVQRSEKYTEQKNGLAGAKKNQELSASPLAKQKKTETNNMQPGAVLSETQNVTNESK